MSRHKPDPNKTVDLTIDGIAITVPEGTRILEAAEKAGAHIPTLCDYEGLGRRAVCRICAVECDGRSKLVPACANEVWEGVNIVTNNPRILDIRKIIVELLLANHPQECLVCIRSGKCELQKLAAEFGIREKPFHHIHIKKHPPEKVNEILVRDMDKCVKCGRCVEACQEIQTVRAINSGYRSLNYKICTPYNEALGVGACIYCGQCAEVCPVGAIYENDQTALVWETLNNKERKPVTQIAASTGRAMDDEFGLKPGTAASGKIVTALKELGFDKIYDAGLAAKASIKETAKELLDRINNKGKSAKPLPMIVSCSPALNNFVKGFYPNLFDHLSTGKSPEQVFSALVKTGPEASRISYISVMPCIAKKPEARRTEPCGADTALTVKELARMIRLAGIDFANLPETPFDVLPEGGAGGKTDGALEALLSGAYQAYAGAGTRPEGTNIKVLEADSLADVRKILDLIYKGECDAELVLVRTCPVCAAGFSS